ncbi:hypothetical protein Dsin_032355 [Dipteronia sinensis]|uniref:RNase H type-1 domain-containing protein n=1 Tax=Dipteronia sinensis TaxID=43782 RepID=A0AAD9ZPN8_9ROSI|nr:hypothetical protein Dsin_032355 [Dipteronia sinensis]
MVLCIFSYFVGFQDSISSELLAINKACFLCSSNTDLQELEIEIVSDSSTAVSWINSDSFGSIVHVEMVYKIREFMRSHGRMRVSFSSRASNSFADNLAKKGSNREGDFVQWGNS